MRLYHMPGSRSGRVLWLLEEIGEPYDITIITREEKQLPDHLTRHPLGRVPVLEDDEGFLFESAALCLHLGDIPPEAGLVPPLGTHDRALVYQWACFAPAELEPPLFETWSQAERDPERAAAARKRFDAASAAVADSLNGNAHLVGDRFTVADVLVGTALQFTVRAGIADELPGTLKDYVGRLAQRPAFQRAVKRTFS